jgi:hypothetical protein
MINQSAGAAHVQEVDVAGRTVADVDSHLVYGRARLTGPGHGQVLFPAKDW